MNRKLLTVSEVAARLQCHPHTVRRWIWDRKLRAVKVGDLVRVPEQELAKLTQPADRRRRRGREPRKGGPKQLLATIRKLRNKVDPDDVRLLERLIAEGEQAADWTNSIG